MKTISLNVEMAFCEECALALRRFIGHMDGVSSIDMENGKIIVSFEDGRITEENILKITRKNIEQLGYKMTG